jgi:hypothetical protein
VNLKRPIPIEVLETHYGWTVAQIGEEGWLVCCCGQAFSLAGFRRDNLDYKHVWIHHLRVEAGIVPKLEKRGPTGRRRK